MSHLKYKASIDLIERLLDEEDLQYELDLDEIRSAPFSHPVRKRVFAGIALLRQRRVMAYRATLIVLKETAKVEAFDA